MHESTRATLAACQLRSRGERGANAPANDDALRERAAFRAAAWLDARARDAAPRRQTLAGLRAEPLPGADPRAVWWRAAGPERGGVRTELFPHVRPPWRAGGRGGDDANELSAADPALAEHRRAAEAWSPPDLARRGPPHWPRLVNVVRVDDGQSAPGAEVRPGAEGVVPGHVARFVAGELTTLDPCWIRPVDLPAGPAPHEADAISPRQHDRLLGRLSGVFTVGGDTRPIYLARVGGGGVGADTPLELLASCVDLLEWTLVDVAANVTRLTVNRAASLRLREREPGEALLDLGGGPTNSVFWQGPGGEPPRWRVSPWLRASLRVGEESGAGFLHLGGAAGAGGNVFHLPPPSGGENRVRWPGSKPPGIHSHLYVATLSQQQQNIQLEWGYPGVTGGFYAADDLARLPTKYVTIQRGVVTGIQGVAPPPPGDQGVVECPVEHEPPFDPCED